jgi:hypothetical protein
LRELILPALTSSADRQVRETAARMIDFKLLRNGLAITEEELVEIRRITGITRFRSVSAEHGLRDFSAAGKVVEPFFVRVIADTTGYCAGAGNFAKQPGTSGVRVPVGLTTEFLVEVSAPGYRNWFYSDPSDPSRPVLRLASGEERSLDVLLEPK